MESPDQRHITARLAATLAVAGCVLVSACTRPAPGPELESVAPSTAAPTTAVPAQAVEVAAEPEPPTIEQLAPWLLAWQAAEWDAAFAYARAIMPPAPAPVAPQRPQAARVPSAPAKAPAAPQRSTGGAPGGFLACVRQRESGGNYSAVNGSSGAGGAYQLMPSTWRALGGQGLPQHASPAQQDAMALKLYGQAGRSPWAGGQYNC